MGEAKRRAAAGLGPRPAGERYARATRGERTPENPAAEQSKEWMRAWLKSQFAKRKGGSK